MKTEETAMLGKYKINFLTDIIRSISCNRDKISMLYGKTQSLI